jgi:hypothetical protein
MGSGQADHYSKAAPLEANREVSLKVEKTIQDKIQEQFGQVLLNVIPFSRKEVV